MQSQELNVKIRKRIGKEGSRQIRKEGNVPAIYYGPGKQGTNILLNPKELDKALSSETGLNTLLQLTVESGEPPNGQMAIVKDRQVDPLSRRLIHVDLYEVDLKKKIVVEVKVILTGKAKGLVDGGILDQQRREIEVECLPNNIPTQIEVDVTELGMGDSIHARDLNMPKDVELYVDEGITIASVVAPAAEEEAAPAETAEGDAAAAAPAAGEKKEEGKPAAEGDSK